jgi:hypothetical protein
MHCERNSGSRVSTTIERVIGGPNGFVQLGDASVVLLAHYLDVTQSSAIEIHVVAYGEQSGVSMANSKDYDQSEMAGGDNSVGNKSSAD